MPPLVTCICPTMPSRAAWLPKAIKCFQDQDYGNAELLIVGKIDFATIAEAIALDPAISYFDHDPPTLGDKRNMACEAAAGEFIAHWDDDDWSAPGRLTDQVNRLFESGKAVTGYHSMRFTDGTRWWHNGNHHGQWAFGTSLCYRRAWWNLHPFPDMNIGEDATFTLWAVRTKQLIAVDAGEMMYATIHPGNTSPRNVGAGWTELHA